MADFIDERDDDYPPGTGAAWRWTVEVGACPVFLTRALLDAIDARTGVPIGGRSSLLATHLDAWNWMGAQWTEREIGPASMRVFPKPDKSNDPVELLDALVRMYLSTPPHRRAHIMWRPDTEIAKT